jgi:8-oxo-dGTP pyrophosphatase MutT (NUDIX family)
MSALDQERIRDIFTSLAPRSIDNESLARAAVLIPLIQNDADWSVLLTRRTDQVRHHKGQISFPGGARDGAEELRRTALRETQEELGIAPEAVTILGRFHEYLSSSNFRVTPFVALIAPGTPLKPNRVEVSYVVETPLTFFLENEPVCRTMVRFGRNVPVYFYYFQQEVIWGLTALILRDFVALLKEAG